MPTACPNRAMYPVRPRPLNKTRPSYAGSVANAALSCTHPAVRGHKIKTQACARHVVMNNTALHMMRDVCRNKEKGERSLPHLASAVIGRILDQAATRWSSAAAAWKPIPPAGAAPSWRTWRSAAQNAPEQSAAVDGRLPPPGFDSREVG